MRYGVADNDTNTNIDFAADDMHDPDAVERERLTFVLRALREGRLHEAEEALDYLDFIQEEMS